MLQKPVIIDIQSRTTDYDRFSHMNNARYLEILETARELYFLEYVNVDLVKFCAFTVSQSIEYLKPAPIGQNLSVEITMGDIGTSRVGVLFKITNRETREVYAKGAINQITMSYENFKPTPTPLLYIEKMKSIHYISDLD